MDMDRKSRLLSTCFRSVFSLPLMDVLEKHTCLFLEPPNIQVQAALKPMGKQARSAVCGRMESMGWPCHRHGGTLGLHLPAWTSFGS